MAFKQGLPIGLLAPAAARVAREIDQNPTLDRRDPAAFHDDFLDVDELRQVLPELSSFDAEDQAVLRKMASRLKLEVAGEAPATMWKDLPPEPFLSEWDQVTGGAAVGAHLFVLQNRDGLLRYDPESQRWSQVGLPSWVPPDRFGDRRATHLSPVGDVLAVLAGTGKDWSLSSYDPRSRAWSRSAFSAQRDFTDAAVVASGQRLFLLGGEPGNGVGTAQVVDLKTGQSAELPPLPVDRAGAAAAAVGDRVYLIGGSGADGKPIGRVDVFNVKSGKWEAPLTVPARVRPSVWVEEGRIHIAGGFEEGSHAFLSSVHDILEVTDPRHPVVTEGPALPLEQGGSAAVIASRGSLFVFGVDARVVQPTVFARQRVPVVEPDDLFAPVVIHQTTNIHEDRSVHIDNLKVVINKPRVAIHVKRGPFDARELTLPDKLPNVTVQPVPFSSQETEEGFYDANGKVVVRTRANEDDLIGVVNNEDGTRTLVGHASDGKGPLPPNRVAGLYLYEPQTGALIELQTDAQGQFAVNLPRGTGDDVYIFDTASGPSAPAGKIPIPPAG